MLVMASISIGVMSFRPRQSAAQLYAGAFVGEVKGLSKRASQAHLAVLFFFTLMIFLGGHAVFVSPFWIPAPSSEVLVVERVLWHKDPLEATSIVLPHQKIPQFGAKAKLTLQAMFDLDKREENNTALYIPVHFNRLSVRINGTKLLTTEDDGNNPLAMWWRSSFFLIPHDAVMSEGNLLTIELDDSSGQLLDFSRIFIGSHHTLQQSYERREFVSSAVLGVVLFGAVWASISAFALRYAGGQRFLLATMPISWMIVLQALLQLSSNSWITPAIQVLLWYTNGLLIVFGSLMFSHGHWRSNRVFRGLVVLWMLLSAIAIASYRFGFVDALVLNWWTTFMLILIIVVLMTVLLGSAMQTIYREESRSINPFLVQVIHSRVTGSALLWLLIFSMLGYIDQVPMVMVNTSFVVMSLNSSIVALISAVARHQELVGYREDLQAKVQEQERQVCLMDHKHLEAMRWSVIGQSAQTLVEEINTPLARMSSDLKIVRLDEGFAPHEKQWARLNHCTDRCLEHVRVVETLIKEDDVHLTSFRMDSFISRCMASLQEDYVFEWSLQSSIRGWIEADEHYLYCVVENLVDNAHHSADAAGCSLTLQLNLSLEGDFLRLCFQDNGTGIDNSEDVFQAFHTSKAFGLGLGVNLAQKHLNGMGGFLSQEPCEVGAKFCVHLPRGTQH